MSEENMKFEPLYIKIIAFGCFVLLAILVWQTERILEAVTWVPEKTIKFIHTELNP